MLLQPSREFIKKGTLQKMSRKNLTQRMFFLVSIYYRMVYYLDDPIPNDVWALTTLYQTNADL
jgi:hypothetical protein